MTIIKLTETQLLDYINCPAFFDMKYVKKLPISHEKESLSSLLTKVSNFFYLHLLNGKVCRLDELKKKWDSICNSHNLTQKEAIEGMQMIAKFANWMGHEQPVVLDINTPYTVKIGNVELSGNMSPIFKRGEGVEFVVTDFSRRTPDQLLIDMKMKYTLDAYTYRILYGEEAYGTRVHNVKNDREFKTLRSNTQFDRLESTIIGVGKALEGKSFYTRESFMCANCPAINYCNSWTNDI